MVDPAIDRDPTREDLERALEGKTLEEATQFLVDEAGLAVPERLEDACDSFFLEFAVVHTNGRTYNLHLESGTVQFVTLEDG